MNEFPERRETYIPAGAKILAENELFILYTYMGVRTLQDKIQDMYSVSDEFHYRMLLKLLKIKVKKQ